MKTKCLNCNNIANFEVNFGFDGDMERISLCHSCLHKLQSSQRYQEEVLSNQIKDKLLQQRGSRGTKPNQDDSLLDLTEKMKDSKDEILFRDNELKRVVQILSRKNKNNPILIGEAGVGKTAIAELLAKEISNNRIPRFKGYKVKSLDMSGLMSDTKFRGQFEEKIKKLINDIKGKTILFIDEIHLLVGAGAGQVNDVDFSNLLKPHLSKGEIKVLGATTLDEYRTIEKDSALERRFQPVLVKPFNKKQTKELLLNVKGSYESFHNVELPDNLVDQLVDLADEFLKERNFPDKALDVLDEALSKLSVENYNDDHNKEEEFKEIIENTKSFFEKNSILSTGEFEEILKNNRKINRHKITELDLVKVIEEMSGVPVSVIKLGNKEKIKNLTNELSEHVIGQHQAIETLSNAMKRFLVRVKSRKKPTVLFFAGPTGVGKTESVKALARSMFGSEEQIVRLDMSEYMEEHSVSKLIGSPPGYVGYEEEGFLTESVRRNPFSIILLDEFEKAHPKVSQMFLQTFDEGRMTDNKGRVVDFTNSIIVMTSNIGAKSPNHIGFGQSKDVETNSTLEALHKSYAPEFLNRIDDIIVFNRLNREDLREIASLMVNEYKLEIKRNHNIDLSLCEDSIDHLVEKGYNPDMGARPLSRAITQELENLLIDTLLDSEGVDSLSIELCEGALEVV